MPPGFLISGIFCIGAPVPWSMPMQSVRAEKHRGRIPDKLGMWPLPILCV